MIAHAVITAAVQIGLIKAGVPPLLAGALPVTFYAGREHAQAEQRIIEKSFGRRGLMPWWGGFLPAAWTRDALADVLAPVAVAIIIAALWPA